MFNPFRVVKLIWEKKEAELAADVSRAKSAEKLFEEIPRGFADRDENDWELLGSAYKGNFGFDQRVMAAKARHFVRTDPNARAALRFTLDYLLGTGVVITPKSEDPRVAYVWKDFSTSPRNRWQLRVRDIAKRWLRDGEWFLRFFKNQQSDGEVTATWKTTVRFIDALQVKREIPGKTETETDKLNAGIETDPNDAEKVIQYHVVDPFDPAKRFLVPAAEVQHAKFFADMDQPRGDSMLLPIMKLIPAYEQWMKYRLVLNKVRTAMVLIKQIEGNPTQVASLRDSIPNSAKTAPTSGPLKQMPKAGTMLTANAGVNYKMESPNINATDAAEDGRNIILRMAAGIGLPEFGFGDNSNNNYSSALVSEGPLAKMIQALRAELEIHFKTIYRMVIQAAVDAEAIEAPVDPDVLTLLGNKLDVSESGRKALREAQGADPDGDGDDDSKESESSNADTPTEIFFGCDIEWPAIEHREIDKLTTALVAQRAAGWIDDKSATEELGRDYEEIVRKQRKIEEDAQEDPNPLLGGGSMNDQAGYGEEAASIIADLSPDERQAVLNAKDSASVAAILMGSGKNGVKPGAKPPKAGAPNPAAGGDQ